MLLKRVLAGLVLTAFGVATAQAGPLTMSATYYTAAESGDPDFNTNPCCSSYFTNEIMGTLGPHGLPVYNPAYGGPTLFDVNGSGELTWWSPSQNPNVVMTGTGTVTLPYVNSSFFPPNGSGSGDFAGFQTAIFRGVLNVPVAESVTFTFGADDDSFLALGNTIISQEGGIHPVAGAPVVTSVLSPGTYDLTLFYADRHVTGAGLNFSIDTEGVSITPPPSGPPGVPEPLSLSLLGAGLAGAMGMRRRRKA